MTELAPGGQEKNNNYNNETIAAIATPLGNGGVGIVRISGPQAEEVLRQLFFSPRLPQRLTSHHLYYGQVRDAQGRLLDQGLGVLMRGPASYTGEDVAELQLHGGLRLLQEVLSACLAAGARLATPGEFTLRAYLNDRLDLAQAEAVADLIAAKTLPAAQLAAAQLAGALSQAVERLEEELYRLYGEITVAVDFPEETEEAAPEQLLARLQALIEHIETGLLKNCRQGRLAREGVRAVLLGRVNVGKSSLLNALLGVERAIVTPLAGTTRDLIEESLDLQGQALVLVDTAGLREGEAMDQAELLGQERSREQLSRAQLALVVLDGSRPGPDPAELELLRQTQDRGLAVINKTDAASAPMLRQLCRAVAEIYDEKNIICISCKSGAGLEQLTQAIGARLGRADGEAVSALVSKARHEQALRRTAAALRQCCQGLEQGLPLDLAAIDISEALHSLGQISGKTVSEAVLEDIFSHFCLGK